MGVMVDAVNPANVPAELNGALACRITVLADPRGQMFDYETGNADAASVCRALHVRLARRYWSAVYVNQSQCGEIAAEMEATGLAWAAPERWPGPGVYLWAADPSGNIDAGRWRPPVNPLAVQDDYAGTVDRSRTAANFPVAVAGYLDGRISAWSPQAWARFKIVADAGPVPVPAPPPPPAPPAPAPAPKVVTVLLPVLSDGRTGPPVAAVQRLLGGLADDGVFGPRTLAAVKAFQASHGLAVDGVVGAHTWGALLGAPQ